MMVSVETVLLRGKRRLEKWFRVPILRLVGLLVCYGLGGLVLAAAAIRGQMQPLALGLIGASPGGYCFAAALGSVLGYRLFWGMPGLQGMVWSVAALGLRLGLDTWYHGDQRAGHFAAGTACILSGVGLCFQLWLGDTTPIETYLLRIAVGALGGWVFLRLAISRTRAVLALAEGIGVLALSGVCSLPGLNLGCIAAGVLTTAQALSATAMAGLCLELAGVTALPVTAVLCLAAFLRLLPVRDLWRRTASPAAACLAVMALTGIWDWSTFIALSLGGVLGAVVPWHLEPVISNSGTGPAQVQLERLARTLGTMQGMLLETAPPAVDNQALAEKVRISACSRCAARHRCRESALITEELFDHPLDFHCRKTGLVMQELRLAQEQRKRIVAGHRQREEYRGALVQQYGFLADTLRQTADSLSRRWAVESVHYRLQVSARSRKKEAADGDRCMAFPGTGCRYYVLLCDGMGTGMGAEAESEQSSRLLRQLLQSGVPPQYALGSVNSHLALMGKAGAVTVDLAEIRLDTGRVCLYKWGAAQSYLIRRGQAEKVGTATAPPGLWVNQSQEMTVRLSLSRGETLVLVSDGVELGEVSHWEDLTPGRMAEEILHRGILGQDDATVAVIRLRPTSVGTS